MLTIKDVLQELESIDLPFGEMQQLSSLVSEFGLFGAIEYLKPLKSHSPIVHRDQHMADRHRKILESLPTIPCWLR